MPGADADTVGDAAGLDVELAFRDAALALGAAAAAGDETGELTFVIELGAIALGAGAGGEGRERGKVDDAFEVDSGDAGGRAARLEVGTDADATGRGEGEVANTPGRTAPTGWGPSDCAS
jgi:hypothetical protein